MKTIITAVPLILIGLILIYSWAMIRGELRSAANRKAQP